MDGLFQNVMVWLIVGLAGSYLLWNIVGWMLRKSSGGCGGCHGCGKSNTVPTSLVMLELKPSASEAVER